MSEATHRPLHGGYPTASKAPDRTKPIHLQITAAERDHFIWERRWRVYRLHIAPPAQFADQHGPWSAEQLFRYMGSTCGWEMPA